MLPNHGFFPVAFQTHLLFVHHCTRWLWSFLTRLVLCNELLLILLDGVIENRITLSWLQMLFQVRLRLMNIHIVQELGRFRCSSRVKHEFLTVLGVLYHPLQRAQNFLSFALAALKDGALSVFEVEHVSLNLLSLQMFESNFPAQISPYLELILDV